MNTSLMRAEKSWVQQVYTVSFYALLFFLPFSKAAVESFATLSIFFWIVWKFQTRRQGQKAGTLLPSKKFLLPMLLFVSVQLISVVFSQHFDLSLRAFFSKLGEGIFLAFVAWDIVRLDGFKKIGIVLAVSASVVVADSLYQKVVGVDLLRGYKLQDKANITASFKNPNNLSGWLLLVYFFLAGLLAERLVSLKEKKFFSAVIFALSIALFLTDSRAAWIGFFLGGGFFLFSLFKKWKIKRKSLYLSIGLFVVALFFLPAAIKERAASTFRLSSHVNRLDLWQEALAIIKDFPWCGSGLNTYAITAPKYKISAEGGTYPHNSFLHMAAETGVTGLISFLFLLMVFLKAAIPQIKKEDLLTVAFVCGLFSFLFHSFFDNNIYVLQLSALFWIFLGMLMAKVESADSLKAIKK